MDADEAGLEGPEPRVEPEDTGANVLERPLNPAEIRIDQKLLTVDLLAKRLAAGEIDLAPVFQRRAGPWSDAAQSRLVESMLVRIPIPALYLDATDDERWVVVDGLQRLTAISRFVVKKELRLGGLEYLPLDGSGWDALPRPMQRRIQETQVVAWLIQPGTPPAVRFDVFKRINTGGPPRSPQELRHALNPGPAAELLAELAGSQAFVRATAGGLRDARMTDRECVLRFLAFTLVPPERYESQDLDAFLDAQMRAVNGLGDAERAALAARFEVAMRRAAAAFGDDAFRRRRRAEDAPRPVNKPLFEAWSVSLAALDDARAERLAGRADALRARSAALLDDPELERAVTSGTGGAAAVRLRFERVRALLDEVLPA